MAETRIHNIFTRVFNGGRFSPSHSLVTKHDFEYPTALWLITKMVQVRFFTGVDFHLPLNVQPSTTLNMRLPVA